jgi:hypothetical protein
VLFGWQWWWLLRLPQKIKTHEDGSLEFIAPIRHLTVKLEDLQWIRLNGNGLHQIGFRGGKVRLPAQFNGFHELLMELKSLNPGFQIRRS